jgi:hyperosmotically inducible protein
MRMIATTLLIAGLLGNLGCSKPAASVGAPDAADSNLKQLVQSRLASDPQLAQIDVSAAANQNLVTLSGKVQSEQSRSEAVAVAQGATSGLIIVDKIEVIPDSVPRSEYTEEASRKAQEKAKALGDKLSQTLDDTWIYTKIEGKLAGRSAASALKIHVDVDGDQVTLRGEVDSNAAKQEAERIARETEGVKRVNNLLTVKA